jgi:protein-disulfide isomerase
MANNLLDKAVGALTGAKGATLTGAAILSVATLLAIGRAGPAPATAIDPAGAPGQQTSGAAPALVRGGSFTAAQSQEIQQIVRDYLVKNPDVLVEVSRELEQRQQVAQAVESKKVILTQKARIFAAKSDFVFGNPKGDVSVVEFFDYNCAWCKRAFEEVLKLTKADPQIRIVMKEFPIFGADSTLAAKAAMAATRQGKYWEMHTALMREKQVTKDNLFQIAQRVGLNVEKLKADMEDPKIEAALKDTHEVAQALGVEGTPGFIVDSRLNVGYLPADGIQSLIGEVRKAGCEVC